MKAFSAVTKAVYKVSHFLSSVGLVGIVAVVFLQVICRYILSIGLRWSSELTVYLMTWVVFLSCSCAYKNNEIVGLTLLTDRLPYSGRKLCDILSNLIIVAFMVLSACANTEIVYNGFKKLSSVMHLPLGWVYISWTVNAVIMALYGVEKIFCSIQDWVETNRGSSPAGQG